MKRENLIRNLLTVLFTIGLIFQQAMANPSSYDTTFGSGGTMADDLGSLTKIRKILVQLDGKIVVVGSQKYNGDPTDDRLFVRRYTSTGAIHTTYPLLTGIGHDAEIQLDGKLVILGTKLTTVSGVDTIRPVVWRFNYNGSIDSGFGTLGFKVISTIGASNLHLETYNNNSIIAYASKATSDGATTYKIAKLSSTGSIVFTISPSFYYLSEKAFSMKVDALNGDILAIGTQLITTDVLLRRYNSNGAVVTTFGSGGVKSVYDCFSAELKPKELIIRPDGKIMVHRVNGSAGDVCVTRLMPNGSLDPSFAPVADNFSLVGHNLALQPDGKVFFYVDSGSRRYDAVGTYDLFLYVGTPVWVVQNDQKLITVWTNSETVTLKRYLLD